MGLKTYNPTSPGRRQLITTDRSELWTGKPVKTLTEGLNKTGGRNNAGRTTAYHRGGGHKRSYRMVDFRRTRWDDVATVERLEYDPNRTAWIALVKYEDGELAYIIAPQRLSAGDKVVSSRNTVDVKPGNAMPLERMPVGTIVHNVEMKPLKGGQIACLRLRHCCGADRVKTSGAHPHGLAPFFCFALLKLDDTHAEICGPPGSRVGFAEIPQPVALLGHLVHPRHPRTAIG